MRIAQSRRGKVSVARIRRKAEENRERWHYFWDGERWGAQAYKHILPFHGLSAYVGTLCPRSENRRRYPLHIRLVLLCFKRCCGVTGKEYRTPANLERKLQ